MKRRSSGTLFETTVDSFTNVILDDGVPGLCDDSVSDAQTQGAPTTCSSSSAERVRMEGVLGVQGGELPSVGVGDLETKDAGRWGR